MTKTIVLIDMTEEEREAFVNGWKNAGGYMGDVESFAPWCAPWEWKFAIEVEGETPEEWGASWWNKRRKDVEKYLKEEANV